MLGRKSHAQLDREIADALSRRNDRSSRGTSHATPPRPGRRNPGRWLGTEVQALLFSRPEWDADEAKDWAREHGYRAAKVHVTDNYVRLRQFDPTRGRQKRTITFGKGIKAVVEQVR